MVYSTIDTYKVRLIYGLPIKMSKYLILSLNLDSRKETELIIKTKHTQQK